ncbi:hypothetical protein Pan216_14430 [Planctomycetes bacterium Pan216]|uniref:ABM domain-containing protein n=1 Tax=Kolteria novifilia TaxID=2527975 RepID=A0A518B0U4_9BACT|nr:hypothetical protein Pan216_14430 [Planctomycetes bacterium Pan216]
MVANDVEDPLGDLVVSGAGGPALAIAFQRIPADRQQAYRDWQDGISQVARRFPGFISAFAECPMSEHPEEWITLISFDSREHLEGWLRSPERDHWVERYVREIGQYELRRVQGGLEEWFAIAARDDRQPAPPAWKMMLTVILALYPTLMTLNLTIGPAFRSFDFATAMLLKNLMSVPILQWIVMPLLTKVLGPWLHPKRRRRLTDVAGAVGIVVALLLFMLFFSMFGYP